MILRLLSFALKPYKNYCTPYMYKSLHKPINESLYVKHEGKTTTEA